MSASQLTRSYLLVQRVRSLRLGRTGPRALAYPLTPKAVHLAHVTYLVRDYDEAIAWLSRCLGFVVREDRPMGGGKRWVLVGPAGGGASLLLGRAASAAQEAAVGRQGGGRVFLFLHVDDFAREHARMTAEGVRFVEAPRHEAYGTVAVFEDPYGNRWDLIQPRVAANG